MLELTASLKQVFQETAASRDMSRLKGYERRRFMAQIVDELLGTKTWR